MPDNLSENPRKIKQADLVVGIPSLNEADNIAFVARKADQGLVRFFRNYRAVIVNVDNDSPDNTRAAFLGAPTKTAKIYLSTPPGVRGKGYNFENLFRLVGSLGAKAVAVVDADLESITPDWMRRLLTPILGGYDYAAPYYARSEYDGSITNHICYPFIRGLYGHDIRQPIGGDFSFSPDLAAYWLRQKWHKTTKKYGIDIFMTMNALNGGFKLAQVGLGSKIHKPSAPKLGPMFSQVVITLFKNLKSFRRRWMSIRHKHDIAYSGDKNLGAPQTLGVDYKGMKATCLFNFRLNDDILRRGLSPAVFRRLKQTYDRGEVAIPADLWCRTLYDAFYAFDRTDLGLGLVEALKPVYFGRFVTFYRDTIEKEYGECEKMIKDQAELFWQERNYLFRKYRDYSRKT